MTQNLVLLSTARPAGDASLAHCGPAVKDLFDPNAPGYVLCIPYAHMGDQSENAARFIAAAAKHGVEARSILEFANPAEAIRSSGIKGLFMGGGNAFRVLKQLYDLDLLDLIRRRVQGGLPYMGSSAGVNVACPGIYTTNDMPIVEPPSLKALNLVPFQVNVHYVPGKLVARHHGETREQRIAQFHQVNSTPVIGLPEAMWITARGSEYTLGGEGEAVLFRQHEAPIRLASGQHISR